MRKLMMAMLFVIITVCHSIAGDFTRNDYKTYVGNTGKEVNVGWDPVIGATDYEVEFYHFERNYVVFRGYTTDTSMRYVIPRSGHYIAKARSRFIIDVDSMRGMTADSLKAWIASVKNEKTFNNIDFTNHTKDMLIAAIEKQKYIYSDAAVSINPETSSVDGIPSAWWVYGYTAPPGGIQF